MDNKKYYYLKLKDNFFDSDEVVILESMKDGYIYSNILLKLYLRSLKNEGRLMFNNSIPYNSQMIANLTRHSVGDVEKAVRTLSDLGLIEILDNGAIYMLDIQNFIGESSTEADRKRLYRLKIDNEKQSTKEIGQMSGQISDKSPPEIERELKKEKELEPQPSFDYKKVTELYAEHCKELPQVRALTDNRKKTLKAWGNLEEIEEVFKKAGKSKFLAGANDRKWQANFDWIIKPTNRVKILEDAYVDKEVKEQPKVPRYKDLGAE